jgi:hypothetical protein
MSRIEALLDDWTGEVPMAGVNKARELADRAVAEACEEVKGGWRVEGPPAITRGNHWRYRLRAEDGGHTCTIIASLSPSDVRSWRNLRSTAKRAMMRARGEL